MATERELIGAILADPADDTVRLAYADWLDEQDKPLIPCVNCSGKGYVLGFLDPMSYVFGTPSEVQCGQCNGTAHHPDQTKALRAEFIRLQIAIARGRFDSDQAKEQLVSRSHEILKDRAGQWFGVDPNAVYTGEKPSVLRRPVGWNNIEYHFDRGFASDVTCAGATWLEFADEILAGQPIEIVRLTQPLSSGRSDFIPMPPHWYAITWPRIKFVLPPEISRRP